MVKRNIFLVLVISLVYVSVFASKAISNATAGRGSITIETKKVAEVSLKIKELASELNIVTTNFSERVHSGNNMANFTLELKNTDVPEFLDKISKLGKVTSQNYNESRGYTHNSNENLESLKQRSGVLSDYLAKVLSEQNPAREVVMLFNKEITNIESQINNFQRGAMSENSDKAIMSVQIKTKGFNSSNPSNTAKKTNLLVNIIIGLCALLFGNFIAKRSQKKQILAVINQLVKKNNKQQQK